MIVAMTLVAVFFAYHFNWIRERRREREVFDRYDAQHGRSSDVDWPKTAVNRPQHQSQANDRLPWVLWIFGEKAQGSIIQEWHDEPTWLAETNRLESLFPEAVVKLQLRTITP
jgi:hypothetical protein